MNRKHTIVLTILMLALPLCALAQDDDDNAQQGRVLGSYTVQQSVEFGGRIADNNGNQSMYDTLVNLKSGPRLLGQDLSMRSMNHTGAFFDSLYLSSFGFGGDPNDMARLRIEKNKWYNFVGLYRRDENYFDYNLFANPLNPIQPTGANLLGSQAFLNTPHQQNTVRNMGDFNLTLFPQSAIRFRLGYSRNNNHGPVFSSYHEGTDYGTVEDLTSRSDRYQFGFDIRPAARTTISFDQFLEHDKVDTGFGLNSAYAFPLNSLTGPLVNIGIPFYPAPYNYPCAATANPATGLPATGFATAAGCNLANSYVRSGNVRTNVPTSQLSFQSNYFRKLDITGSATYSWASSDLRNYNEMLNGFVTRTNERILAFTGPGYIERISANADLGLTYHFTRKWSFANKFRWVDWREPGDWNSVENACFPTTTGGNITSAIGALTPFCSSLGATVVSGIHNSSSDEDTGLDHFVRFIGERDFFNTSMVNWDPNRRFSIHVGYRYGRRELRVKDFDSNIDTFLSNTGVQSLTPCSSPLVRPCTSVGTADESAGLFPPTTFKINEHTALFGVVLRPVDAWRVNADAELLSSDNAFTNITPRHQQRVRIGSTYKIRRWASVNASVHFIETRNDFAENINGGTNVTPNLFPSTVTPAYGHKDHYRYYTVGASLNPNSRLSLDFGYTYLDQNINSATCMPVTTGLIPASGALATCPIPAGSAGGPYNLPLTLLYQTNTNTGYVNLAVKPVKRITLYGGYEITSDSGYNNWIQPDTGNNFLVPVAANGTAALPGTTAVTTAPGPNPLQPLATQAMNWQKPYAGIGIDVAKGLMLKGMWYYYDYHEKNPNGLLLPAGLIQPVLARNFHANTGTISLKYSF